MIKYITFVITIPYLTLDMSGTFVTMYLCSTILFLVWYSLFILFKGIKFKKIVNLGLVVVVVTAIWPVLLLWKIKDTIVNRGDWV